MGLPEPAYSFGLPSLHDDTLLDCRIYHPDLATWRRKAAVLAHPYAPLGGSYDDPVVDSVGGELLAAGWVVGTFNFRGALGSAGHTSWTGKPELSDYITFAGFMAHYMDATSGGENGSRHTKLLLGGYSYGSLIVTRLPSTQDILLRFSSPEDGSAAAKVLHRAQTLAAQTIAELHDWQDEHTRSYDKLQDGKGKTHSHTRSITLGGEDSDEASCSSRDGRRSGSFHGLHGKIKGHRERRQRERGNPSIQAAQPGAHDSDMPEAETWYLLVSPLLPPTSLFVAPALLRFRAADSELTTHRTLAVFGGHDMFTSAKRLRPWAQRLAEESEGRFRWAEIEVASHFWHEDGALKALRERVRRWVDE